jgi:hypothetical protein
MTLAAVECMAKTSPSLDPSLRDRLTNLAAFEPHDVPVLSLYLNLTPNERGRDGYQSFVRKVFTDHAKAFA